MKSLDRMLVESGSPMPSEGFVRSVMAAVRLHAEGPPPLSFPWVRLIAVLAVTLLVGPWLLDLLGGAGVGSLLLREPALLWGLILAVASGLVTLVGVELA